MSIPSTLDVLAQLQKLELEPVAEKPDRSRGTDLAFRLLPHTFTGEMEVVYDPDPNSTKFLQSCVIDEAHLLDDPVLEVEKQFLDVTTLDDRPENPRDSFWERDLSTSIRNVQLADLSPPRTTIVSNIQSLIDVGLAFDGFQEVQLSLTDVQSNSNNSTSLQRRWNTNMKDFHRGSSKNFPFLPGGLNKGSRHLELLTSSDIDWDDFNRFFISNSRGCSIQQHPLLAFLTSTLENPKSSPRALMFFRIRRA